MIRRDAFIIAYSLSLCVCASGSFIIYGRSYVKRVRLFRNCGTVCLLCCRCEVGGVVDVGVGATAGACVC